MPETPGRDELREELLQVVYDRVEQSDRPRQVVFLDYRAWAEEKGYDGAAVDRAQQWLVDHGLVEHPVMGPQIVITAAGQDAVETLQRERAREAEAEADTGGAVLTITELRRIEPLLKEIRDLLDAHGDEMDPEDVEDLQSLAGTVEAQQRSPRPRRAIVQAAVSAIRWTADRAAGGVLGNTVFHGVVEAASRIF